MWLSAPVEIPISAANHLGLLWYLAGKQLSLINTLEWWVNDISLTSVDTFSKENSDLKLASLSVDGF